MRLRPKHVHLEAQLGTSLPHDPQSLLEVGAASADKHSDVALDELVLEMRQSSHNALEGGSHVGEVGNPPAYDQHFALGVCLLGHEAQDCLGILERLALTGCTYVQIYNICEMKLVVKSLCIPHWAFHD